MSYTVRLMQPSDVESVLSIFEEVWGKRARSRYLIQAPWYGRRAQCDLNEAVELVIESSGEVVGFARRIECEYNMGSLKVKAGYFTDTVTHPRHRSAGVKLLRALLAEHERLLVGVPVVRAAVLWEKLVKRSPVVAPIARHVLLIEPSSFLHEKGVPNWMARPADAVWAMRLRHTVARFRKQFSNSGITVEDHASNEQGLPSGEEYERFTEEFSSGFRFSLCRTFGYLKWRFVESPYAYRLAWLRDNGELSGCAIYRMTKIKSRNVLLVVEILATRRKELNYSLLLSHLVEAARSNGAADIQALASGCPSALAAFKNFGSFLKQEKESLLAALKVGKEYDRDIYQDGWFLSLGEADYEFVMFPAEEV